MNSQISRESVHERIDPQWFYDYATFSGMFRHYAAKSLEVEFQRDANDFHRRLYLIGLYREEYSAYEDIGAFLSAFLRWIKGTIDFPISEILSYKPSKVVLSKFFENFSICSSNQLYTALDFDSWITPHWNDSHPEINIEKVLHKSCEFIFNDCHKNQRKYGIRAYNKIKHGLLFVPSGNKYKSESPDAPAMIFNNELNASDPYILWAITMDDNNLAQKTRVIEFVQKTLRVFASLYLIHRYPDYLVKIGIEPPEKIFNLPTMSSCKRFMKEITLKE